MKDSDSSDQDNQQKRRLTISYIKKKLTILTAEALLNNSVNPVVFSLFLIIRFGFVLLQMVSIMALEIQPTNQLVNYFLGLAQTNQDPFLYAADGLLLFTLIIFGILFLLAKEKLNPSIFQKILYQIFTFLISFFFTAGAIPFLFINYAYATCQSISSDGQGCFVGINLINFAVSVISLVFYGMLVYYFMKCMNLSIHLPVENYNSPFSTIRTISPFIKLFVNSAVALRLVFNYSKLIKTCFYALVIALYCIVYILQIRVYYYLNYKVQIISTLANSFVIPFQTILLVHLWTAIHFSMNSFIISIVLSLICSVTLTFISYTYRLRAAGNFYRNFTTLQDDIDFCATTIVDLFNSKNKNDVMKIKGLVQSILNNSETVFARKKQKAKRERKKVQLDEFKRILALNKEKDKASEEKKQPQRNQTEEDNSILMNTSQFKLRSEHSRNSFNENQSNDQIQIENQEFNFPSREQVALHAKLNFDTQPVYTDQDSEVLIKCIQYFLKMLKRESKHQANEIRMTLILLRLVYMTHLEDQLYYLMYLVSTLKLKPINFSQGVVKYIFDKKFQSRFASLLLEREDKMNPTIMVFQEDQREIFEDAISYSTDQMLSFIKQLQYQGNSAPEIYSRFENARMIIGQTIDLQKRFKEMCLMHRDSTEVMIIYFYFLDQVVHLETEAFNVSKIVTEIQQQNRLNKRFEDVDELNAGRKGFVLVSGNAESMGTIFKLNTTFCRGLKFYKQDLSDKNINQIMPPTFQLFHKKVFHRYRFAVNIAPSKKISKYSTNSKDHLRALEEQNNILKWHLTERNKIHFMSDKDLNLVPFICNFDLFFDVQLGIQFMVLTSKMENIRLRDTKLKLKNVFFIQTSQFGIIEGCCQNFANRFQLVIPKMIEKMISIDFLHPELMSLKNTTINKLGIPLLLDFSIFEELKEQQQAEMEEFENVVTLPQQRLISIRNDVSQTVDLRVLEILQKERKIPCFVQRKLVGKKNIVNEESDDSDKQEFWGMIFTVVFYENMTTWMKEEMQEHIKEWIEANDISFEKEVHNDISFNPLYSNSQSNAADIQIVHEANEDDEHQQETENTQEKYTFGSTSSTTSTLDLNAKIMEIKSEGLLSKKAAFISLFEKLFGLFFVLFVAVGTAVLLTQFNSNTAFLEMFLIVHQAKLFMISSTGIGLGHQSCLEVANNLEPMTSDIFTERFTSANKFDSTMISEMQKYGNVVKEYITSSNDQELKDFFFAQPVLVKELNLNHEVTYRNYTFDNAFNLYIAKASEFDFTQASLNSTLSYLQSFTFSVSDSFLQTMHNLQIPAKQLERDGFWIVINSKMHFSEALRVLTLKLQSQFQASIGGYANKIIIMSCCCIGISFICSAAFVPVFLKLRRNLNLNINLIERLSKESLQQIQVKIEEFKEKLQNQLGQQKNDIQRKNEVKATVIEAQIVPSQTKSNYNALKNKLQPKQKIKMRKMKKGEKLNSTNQTMKTQDNIFNKDEGGIEEEEKEEYDYPHNSPNKNNQDDDSESRSEEGKHEKHKEKKSKHKSLEKKNKQNSDLGKESEVEMNIKVKLRGIEDLYKKTKSQTIALAIVVSIFISIFFIVQQQLVLQTFKDAESGIVQLQAFYDMEPLYVKIAQISRGQYNQNQTDIFIYNGRSDIFDIFSDYFSAIKQVQDIEQQNLKMLSSVTGLLRELDSPKFCQLAMPMINESVSACQGMSNNVFANGFTVAMATFSNYYYFQQLQFQNMQPYQRTKDYLSSLLNSMQSINFMDLYIRILHKVLFLIQSSVVGSFNLYFTGQTMNLVAVYAIFMALLVFGIIFIESFLMKRMQREVYLTRKTIQLIPHADLILQDNFEIASQILY